MTVTDRERIEELEATVAFLKQELGWNRPDADRVAVQREFKLTRTEADLLLYLYRRRGGWASKMLIFEAVWGLENDKDMKTVDVYTCRIRQKLGPDVIETLWGQGKRLSAPFADRIKKLLDKLLH